MTPPDLVQTLQSRPAPRSVAEGQRAAGDFNVAAHGLRGLASVMVLGAHVLWGTAEYIYPTNAAYVAFIEHPWYFGTYGVLLFFMISGFVIIPSALRYAPREFALRRALRIYPLFFVLSVVFVGLNAATNAYPALNNVETVVAGLLFINLFTGTEQLTPNAWSLTFEVMFYILTCAVVHFTVRRPRRVLAALAVAASLAFFAAFPVSIFFVIGIGIRLAYDRLALSGDTRIAEALSAATAVAFAAQGHFEYRWADFLNPVVIPIVLSTAVYFALAVKPNSLTSALMNNRVASYAGTVSYSLYLVHPYVYFSARELFKQWGLFGANIPVSVAVFMTVVVALSFAASHVVHIMLERRPYEWFFHQRIYRARVRSSP